MDMQQLIKNEQIKYAKPISIVHQFLERYIDIPMQIDHIHVTPFWPFGWKAEIVSEDGVWTIECHSGFITLISVADYDGTMSNGTFMQDRVEDISECQQEYLSECYHAGLDCRPIMCTDFDFKNEMKCWLCPKEYDLEFQKGVYDE